MAWITNWPFKYWFHYLNTSSVIPKAGIRILAPFHSSQNLFQTGFIMFAETRQHPGDGRGLRAWSGQDCWHGFCPFVQFAVEAVGRSRPGGRHFLVSSSRIAPRRTALHKSHRLHLRRAVNIRTDLPLSSRRHQDLKPLPSWSGETSRPQTLKIMIRSEYLLSWIILWWKIPLRAKRVGR